MLHYFQGDNINHRQVFLPHMVEEQLVGFKHLQTNFTPVRALFWEVAMLRVVHLQNDGAVCLKIFVGSKDSGMNWDHFSSSGVGDGGQLGLEIVVDQWGGWRCCHR